MGAFLLLPPPLVLAKGAQKLKYSFNIYVKQKPEKKEQKNFNFNLKKTAQIDKSPAPHWRENPLEEEGGGGTGLLVGFGSRWGAFPFSARDGY